MKQLEAEVERLRAEIERLTAELAACRVATRRLRGYKIDATKIRALHAQGLRDREIAERFGCSPVSVLRWRRLFGLEAHGRRNTDASR